MESSVLLGHSADWWNGVMVLSLGVAAFVAFFVAAATTGSVLATKRENAAAQLRIATLEDSTAKAQAEAQRLKALVNWREIEPDTLTELISDLAALKGSVTFAYVQNDPEVINFTSLLQKVFAAANDSGGGWQVGAQPRMYTDRNILGLYIFGKDGAALDGARAAFAKARYAFSPERVPTPVTQVGAMTTTMAEPTTDVVVLVGSKRPPNF